MPDTTVTALLGQCAVRLREQVTFSPPVHLFPEIADLTKRRDGVKAETEEDADIVANVPLPVSTAVDVARSSWRLVTFNDDDDASTLVSVGATNRGASGSSTREILARLVQRGQLSLGSTRRERPDEGPCAEIPSTAAVLAQLRALVEVLCERRGSLSAEEQLALLSPSFLYYLAAQRIEVLLETARAAVATGTTTVATAAAAAADGGAGVPPKKTYRAESRTTQWSAHAATTSHGSPSVDPWDADANSRNEPSVSLSAVLEQQTPAAIAEALGHLNVSWPQRCSVGIQTNVVVPGANTTRPEATVPETIRNVTLDTTLPTCSRTNSNPSQGLVFQHDDDGGDNGAPPAAAHPETIWFNAKGPLYAGTAMVAQSPWHLCLTEYLKNAPKRAATGDDAGADAWISPLHFVILPQASGMEHGAKPRYVLLNYSRNGVHINQRWVLGGEPVALQVGDVLRLHGRASWSLRVVAASEPGAEEEGDEEGAPR